MGITREEVACLRETILRHLGRRVGKSFSQIRSAVENDYGKIARRKDSADRRLYRHLEALVDAGCIRRERDEDLQWADDTGTGHCAPQFYYYYVHDRLPERKTQACHVCGLVGANTRGHARGHVRFFREGLRGKQPVYIEVKSAERRPSCESPGSPQPAGSAGQPAHPLRAEHHAR